MRNPAVTRPETSSRPFHPPLVGIYPVLLLYGANVHHTPILAVFRPGLVLLAISLLLWALLALATRERSRSAAIASLLTLASSSAGRFITIQDPALYWALVGAAATLIAFGILRPAVNASALTKVLNLVSVVLVIGAMLPLLIQLPNLLMPAEANSALPKSQQTSLAQNPPPDIYLIVLDGYARDDVLASRYGLDNTPFLAALEKLGFLVDRNAVANYSQTYLVMTALMNGRHLLEIPAIDQRLIRGGGPAARGLLRHLIRDSEMRRALEGLGYQTVAFSSGYHGTELSDADHYVASRWLPNEFEDALISASILPSIFEQLETPNQYDSHRSRIRNILRRLPTVTQGRSRPQFVFAHVLSPHPPFVFNSDGSPHDPNRPFNLLDGDAYLKLESSEEYREGYRQQITYLNGALLESLEGLLNTGRPAVILLTSDHGPGLGYHNTNLESTDLVERFGILTAVRATGIDSAALAAYRSPVNLLRLTLDRVLGIPTPPTEIRSYYSPWSRPLSLRSVSSQLESKGRGQPIPNRSRN